MGSGPIVMSASTDMPELIRSAAMWSNSLTGILTLMGRTPLMKLLVAFSGRVDASL
jgi:hypothetical protein